MIVETLTKIVGIKMKIKIKNKLKANIWSLILIDQIVKELESISLIKWKNN